MQSMKSKEDGGKGGISDAWNILESHKEMRRNNMIQQYFTR